MIMYYVLGGIVFLTLVVVVFLLFTFSKESPGKDEVKIEPLVNKDVFKEKSFELEHQLNASVAKEQELKKKIEDLEDELRIIADKSLDKAQEDIAKLEVLSSENKDLKERVAKEEQSYAQQFNLAQEQMQGLNQENAALKLELQESLAKNKALEAQVIASKEQMEADLIQARQMVEQAKNERDAFIANREASLQSVSTLTREFEEIKKSNEVLLSEVEMLRLDNQELKELNAQINQRNQSLQYDLAKHRAQASGLEKICENYKLQLAAKV